MDYPAGWSDPRPYWGILFFVFLLVAGFTALRHKRLVQAMGIFWFIFCLAPFCGIYPLPFYKADHYLYFPLAGAALGFAGALDYLIQNAGFKRPAVYISALLILFYAVIAIKQNAYWADAIGFYKTTLAYSPQSVRIRVMLGNEYLDRGRTADAIAQFKELIRIHPENSQGYYNLGLAYMSAGNKAAAVAPLKKSIELEDGEFAAYFNSAAILYSLGYKDEALTAWEKAAVRYPAHGSTYANIAAVYIDRGDCAPAKAYIDQAVVNGYTVNAGMKEYYETCK